MWDPVLMRNWDTQADAAGFDPSRTRLRTIDVDGHAFLLCSVPRSPDSVEIGRYKNFSVRARLSGFRHRCLLIPNRNSRWPIEQWQIEQTLSYCCEVGQIVLYNTYLSGGSHPPSTHFQCFPTHVLDGEQRYSLTALPPDGPVARLVDRGDMPHFERISLMLPLRPPVPALRIDVDDASDAPQLAQAAMKLYELAVAWHGLKAFNLYFVPHEGSAGGARGCAAYFMPRRRDGQVVPRCLAGLYREETGVPARWQFAALELGGTLQAKNHGMYEGLSGPEVALALREVTPEVGQASEELRTLAWSF